MRPVSGASPDRRSIKLSMDGQGRATDNAFIEAFWKNIKYEKIYLNPPVDGLHLYELADEYFTYYNNEREHSSIEDRIPYEYYCEQLKVAA